MKTKSYNLTQDTVGEWIEADDYGHEAESAAIQVSYSDAAGDPLDGELYIEIALSDTPSRIDTPVMISAADNTDDAALYQIDTAFRTFRINYLAGGVSSVNIRIDYNHKPLRYF
ncbi:MAG: hypothetical protein ACLFQX_08185 [Candidatus Kapaibacterium sp.]